MRKADYFLLAQIIKKTREDCKKNIDSFNPGTPSAEYWRGRFGLAGHIAFDFSEGAKITAPMRDEFLTLCGLTI